MSSFQFQRMVSYLFCTFTKNYSTPAKFLKLTWLVSLITVIMGRSLVPWVCNSCCTLTTLSWVGCLLRAGKDQCFLLLRWNSSLVQKYVCGTPSEVGGIQSILIVKLRWKFENSLPADAGCLQFPLSEKQCHSRFLRILANTFCVIANTFFTMVLRKLFNFSVSQKTANFCLPYRDAELTSLS